MRKRNCARVSPPDASKKLRSEVAKLLGMADSGLDTKDNVRRLKRIAKKIFRDADCWPDGQTAYFVGKVPLIEASIQGGEAQARQRAVARIASSWQTASVRLAGRLQSMMRSQRFRSRIARDRGRAPVVGGDV